MPKGLERWKQHKKSHLETPEKFSWQKSFETDFLPRKKTDWELAKYLNTGFGKIFLKALLVAPKAYV